MVRDHRYPYNNIRTLQTNISIIIQIIYIQHSFTILNMSIRHIIPMGKYSETYNYTYLDARIYTYKVLNK